MSDYDKNSFPLSLMKGRLGIYDDNKHPYNPDEQSLEGVQLHGNWGQRNGLTQQERMIKDKRRTLDRAVQYSYQAAKIKKINTDNLIRALINPNKLKLDYDDKVLSVGYEYGFKVGDIFEWTGTNTKWIIYLQDTTELAYFRGDIRKCNHIIQWKDENNNIQSINVAIRGPVETKIVTTMKHKTRLDSPNYSLHILMPLTKQTKEKFVRYTKFYLQGDNTCWQIEATDSVSSPGILEITAVEFYANKDADNINEGIVDGLIVKPEDPNPLDNLIIGETFIKPKIHYTYKYTGNDLNNWFIDKKYPISYTIDKNNNKNIILQWDANYSGEFILNYGENKKTIVVESLF